jgi:hypothetical protein
MAKSKTTAKAPVVTDRSFWWTDINYVPTDWKDSQLWFAQNLFFAKLNSQPLVPKDRVATYRKLGRMEINRQEYINMIDPPTPMGGGGTAEFFGSNFKDNPIRQHLDNILRARLSKMCDTDSIEVNEIDKFAKSQRQLEKDKFIAQREFTKLINSINKMVDLPPIKEGENPFDYAKSLNGEDVKQNVDKLGRQMKEVRDRIVDRKDWAIYDRYMYKGDIERCFEMAIKHYMINLNKWNVKSELFIDDIKNFTAFCGRAYTDNTTGRRNILYISPETLNTNPFVQLDGEDIEYWFHEYDVTFADFIRMFGTKLTNEEMKEVFEQNKVMGACHSQSWSQTSSKRRNSALIRIGFYSVLSQEDNKFAEDYVANGIPAWEPKPLSWEADTDSAEEKRKVYNVWHSCYYVPPPGNILNNTTNIQASWEWQARFIFNIEKNTDMYRYGQDMRLHVPNLLCGKIHVHRLPILKKGICH